MKRILTRVEGEGSILIVEKDGYVDSVVYEISETPRFFEYFVRGLSPEREL
jgi:coenzyme F420-reducing hydrogenase alpha subunit